MVENDWTRPQKELIQLWLQRAKILRLIHQKATRFYLRMHQYVSLPASIFSALSTGILCTQLRDAGIPVPTWLVILNVIVSTLATILIVIRSFYNFEDIAQKHNAAHDNYNSLTNDLEIQNSLEPEDREPFKSFIVKVKSRFDTINSNTPTIPNRIFRRFREQIKNKILTLNFEDLVQKKLPTYFKEEEQLRRKKKKKRRRKKKDEIVEIV